MRSREDFPAASECTCSIRSIEQPKGCIKILAFLKENQPACISEIMRFTGLSQDCVYSSLERLERLEMLRADLEEPIRGRPRPCSLTEWGDRVGNIALAFIDTLREITGKYNIDAYLKAPVGSYSILIHISRNGSMTLGEATADLGLCIGSAKSSLIHLRKLGIIQCKRKKRFRRTYKIYRLTEDGKVLVRYLDTLDMALRWRDGC